MDAAPISWPQGSKDAHNRDEHVPGSMARIGCVLIELGGIYMKNTSVHMQNHKSPAKYTSFAHIGHVKVATCLS